MISNTSYSQEKKKNAFLTLAFLHLLFLNLFKDPELFPDLDEYDIYFKGLSKSFSNISAEREGDRVEHGWYFFNKILHMLFDDNSFVLIFLMAVATLFCYMVAIKKYSKCIWLSVFILFCTNYYPSLFVLRQHFAIPICFLSIQYIIIRDLKKFLLVVFFATLFHYSAIIWIPTYFLYNIRFRFKYFVYSLVLLYVFSILMERILNNLSLILPIVASYGVEAFGGVATEGGAYKPFLFDLIIILIVIRSYDGIKRFSGLDRFCLLMMYIGLLMDIFHIVGSVFAEFSRLGLYFSGCGIFLIPNAISQIRNNVLKKSVTITICILYLFILNAFCNYGYHFIF